MIWIAMMIGVVAFHLGHQYGRKSFIDPFAFCITNDRGCREAWELLDTRAKEYFKRVRS